MPNPDTRAVVRVTQEDREAADALDDALGFLTATERLIIEKALASHRQLGEERGRGAAGDAPYTLRETMAAMVLEHDAGGITLRTMEEAREHLVAEARVSAREEVFDWFGKQRRLALDFYSPTYGDDDDQSQEWRVTKESGSINDREWDIVGRGETPTAAILAARAALHTDGAGS